MELRLDMLTLCRTCLQDGEAHMVSIYEGGDDKLRGGLSLCEKIESLSGIQIKPTEEEDLPTRICLRCKAFLTLAHKFRQICQRSNEFLREYVVKDAVAQDAMEEVPKDAGEEVATPPDPTPPPPVETEHFEPLEVEVLEEGAWSTEDHTEETPPPLPAEKEKPLVLAMQMLPAAISVPALLSTAPAIPPKLHVCEICGNGYPRKSTLDSHMRRHNDERPYECEICHKSFHVNYQLKRHIRQHTGARPYTCQYCQRSFADRTSLVKHERTHRNERPYECKTCGKTFTYSSVLKMHYKTHTGEKPHICRLCGKTFARIHNLVAHLQTQQHINDPRLPAYLSTLKMGSTTNIA
ncbi:gastrula zinc finger protein XlCGF52.1 [Drosophila biarmipes]|uniref:gastrula zinc finger protein XlCGF52.1 n=1 Tax=Drosophila biarmipes TaxID=125945 RepID=UPI0007E71208|nr:gastrula zinc finger protein XlCGF52.1 [Drosophila biarmipes]